MSAQASKAARELAHKLFADNQAIKREWAMKEIQSALADLLKKARAVRDSYEAHLPEHDIHMNYLPLSIREFDKSLEPWEAGE